MVVDDAAPIRDDIGGGPVRPKIYIPGLLEEIPSLDHYSPPNNHAQWIHSVQVFMQYFGKKIHLPVASYTTVFKLDELLIIASSRHY
ncbi:hypothetical protein TNCV_2330561 [Trichonephila clavipes]|nr:hypothetical protein TNCV_2330561 [Trichonephila clavipes]